MDKINVNDIICDRALNPRHEGIDQKVVDHYALLFREVIWPPVLVHRESRKLIDGWHRVEAAKRAQVYTIGVQYVDEPLENCFAIAVKANLGHGVALTKEDRFRAINKMLRQSWTPERISEALGIPRIMIDRTEKAENLRIGLRAENRPGANLSTESLAEVVRLPREDQVELADMAIEVSAKPGDVRRAVRAVKNDESISTAEVRKIMMDPEYAKMKKNANITMNGADLLMTFAQIVDQLDTAQYTLEPQEHDAAVTVFFRMREWLDRQISLLTANSNQYETADNIE
jgi:ParB-like chromosome segregation protein Spo0J